MKTLLEAMPKEFLYSGMASVRFAHIPVIAEFRAGDNGVFWPGVHKNVYFWVELENGRLVGWNENPAKGWSFPDMRKPKK